jgi:hypothetical protein
VVAERLEQRKPSDEDGTRLAVHGDQRALSGAAERNFAPS